MGRQVLNLWIRESKGATPEPRESLTLIEGRGVTGDHKLDGKRHVTLLFQDSWHEIETELGREVDPAERRANVYLTGGDPASLIGKTIRLGATVLDIHGEVRPCQQMEDAVTGLLKALVPNCRAGVWGTVTTGGDIRPGDELTVVE
jgi:MOSC domain-containing protein YiiM